MKQEAAEVSIWHDHNASRYRSASRQDSQTRRSRRENLRSTSWLSSITLQVGLFLLLALDGQRKRPSQVASHGQKDPQKVRLSAR
jgi:hypothetical protein